MFDELKKKILELFGQGKTGEYFSADVQDVDKEYSKLSSWLKRQNINDTVGISRDKSAKKLWFKKKKDNNE